MSPESHATTPSSFEVYTDSGNNDDNSSPLNLGVAVEAGVLHLAIAELFLLAVSGNLDAGRAQKILDPENTIAA